MKLPIFAISAILVFSAIHCKVYTPNNNTLRTIVKRQTSSSPDKIVQDILKWVQNVYIKNSRRIRQGTFNEYLPPSNTERPRPFQHGYPPSGLTPSIPFVENPDKIGGGGGSSVDSSKVPSKNNNENYLLLPPIINDNNNGYPKPEYQPGFTIVVPDLSTVPPTETTTTQKPNEGNEVVPDIKQPESINNDVTQSNGIPTTITTQGPGLFSTYVTDGTPVVIPISTGAQYEVGSSLSPSDVDNKHQVLYTSPNELVTNPTTDRLTSVKNPNDSTTTTTGPIAIHIETEETLSPSLTTSKPLEPLPGYTQTTLNADNTPTSPTIISLIEQVSSTTINQEESNIASNPVSVDDDQMDKHPPHIHSINVECGKEMMIIHVEFNREFNGIVYSKGHYDKPECRFVMENSNAKNFTFTINSESCGTEFINAFDTKANQSYLENILVFQNELGIQEIWDTIRTVRCLWENNLKDSLSVAFSIGMLNQEIITFSGDTAMAKLDVLIGRGPFGQPANGLVKIGEPMTLIVSVNSGSTGNNGGTDYDLQVKSCRATDPNKKNIYNLTDDNGCILKPKLFGSFQKTRDTGSTGASIIAYAYFNAFKFPDEMDLIIECNIELCKSNCEMCNDMDQSIDPKQRRKRRRRRESSLWSTSVSNNNNNVISDGMIIGKHMRIILPEDLNAKTALELQTPTITDNICISMELLLFSFAILILTSLICSIIIISIWKVKKKKCT